MSPRCYQHCYTANLRANKNTTRSATADYSRVKKKKPQKRNQKNSGPRERNGPGERWVRPRAAPQALTRPKKTRIWPTNSF